MRPTFVLVHGSNSNSFGWAPLHRELALLGHRSLAVDLPGHGYEAPYLAAYQEPQDLAALSTTRSPLAQVSHADNVARVVDTVRRVAEHGPVVLLGHSRGGLVVSTVANEIPELLDRVVYLSAWCCVELTPQEYALAPENADSALGDTMGMLLGNPAELGAVRLNWRTGDPKLLAALKEAVLAEGTDAEFLAATNLLQPDEGLDVGGAACKITAATLGRVAHHYVRLTADRSIPVALQDRFIREADALSPDNPFRVHTLPSSHLGPLVRPEPLARLLTADW